MGADVRGEMLKIIGIVFSIVIGIYLVLLFAVPVITGKYENARLEEQLRTERENERLLSLTEMELVAMANENIVSSENIIDELDFVLPFGCTGNVIKVTGGLEDRQYVVTIPFAGESYMLDKNVFGDLNPVEDISYKYENHKGIITVSLNNMYEYTTDYDEEKFRLLLIAPKQIYKKIILIDAGAGETQEINRDIVLRIKEKLADEIECGIFYSGLEENDYRSSAEDRIKYADDLAVDYVISIQMNHTASHKNSAINGTQIAYQVSSTASKELAQTYQDLMVEGIGSSDKGIMEMTDEEVYRNLDVCSVVIKPGFMTNTQDMEYMEVPENRQKIADIIYEGLQGIMRD